MIVAGGPVRRRDTVVAVLALVGAIASLLTSPDDLWGHTQPRTIAYTVDVLEHGRWILPHDAEGRPATKPPLYAWLASPAVAITGPASRWGHLAPSLASTLVVWAALVAAGRRWWPRSGHDVGAIAATIWVTALPAAKVAGLARPDMLLTAAATVAFLAVADLAIEARRQGGRLPPSGGTDRRLWIVAGAIAFGGLAKGPAILPAALAVPFVVRLGFDRWPDAIRTVVRPGPMALALLPPAAWFFAAARIDPSWVGGELVGSEFLDRITGRLDDAGAGGLGRLIASSGHYPFYLGVRFLPWSIPLVLAAVLVVRPGAGVRPVARRAADRAIPAAAWVWIAISIVVFTASAGKRADYLAPCLPAASIAAAWWLARGDRRLAWRAPWAIPVAACVLIAMMTLHRQRTSDGIPAAAGQAIADLAAECRGERHRDPSRPIVLLAGVEPSLAVRLGAVPVETAGRHAQLVREGVPHLVAHVALRGPVADLPEAIAAGDGVASVRVLFAATPMPGSRRTAADSGRSHAWGAWLVEVVPRAPSDSRAGERTGR